MTNKPKQSHVSKFDFGDRRLASKNQYGTLKELLEELNYENANSVGGNRAAKSSGSGSEITLKSLHTTLTFLEQISGRRFVGISQECPILDLKTVKLLYVTNDQNDTHLFRLLDSPLRSRKPTIDFYNDGGDRQEAKGVGIVNHLLSSLETEIDQVVKCRVDGAFLTAPKILECVERENFEYILSHVHAVHSGNDGAIAESYELIAEQIGACDIKRDFPYQDRARSNRSLDEVLYTYLRSLPILHFACEHDAVLKIASVDGDIGPAREEIMNLCITLSAESGCEVLSDGPITSVAEFESFVEANASGFARIVKEVTGAPTEGRDIRGMSNYASKVLAMAVFRWRGLTSSSVINISVIECAAALSAIRHQQRAKTNYTPYRFGQSASKIRTNVLGQMRKDRSVASLYEEDYIPEAIALLMSDRFSSFYIGLTGGMGRHLAWMKLQRVRLIKYAECYESNEIGQCNHAVREFNSHCGRLAAFVSYLVAR